MIRIDAVWLSAVARNRTYSAVRARLRFAGSAWLAPVLR
jgi:hypothetical protein